MDKQQIEQAAREYAEENSWYPGETSYESDIKAMEESFADAFKSGAEWQKGIAIEAFKENCPCWSRFQQDRKCDECAYLKDFCNQFD